MALRELLNEIGFKVDMGGLRRADREVDRFERGIAQSFGQMGLRVDRSFDGIGTSAHEAARDVGRATDDMERGLRDVERAADRAGEGLDYGALGGAVGAGGASMAMEGYAASAGHLRAQLGMTVIEAKEFDDIAKNIYRNNFGESFRDTADATSLVYRGLKLTGSELQNQTENAIRLRDVYDHDIRGSVNASRAMMAAWGTEAQKSFDIFALGASRGVDASDDMLDTFTEYPSYFAQIGLTADDMFKYLQIGMSNTGGAFNTDYLADAIKEFGIRIKTPGDTAQKAVQDLFPRQEAARLIRDFGRGGEAGREAFYTVMQQLNKVEDPIKRYGVGVELLGTKFEDLTDFQMGSIISELAAGKDKALETAGATAALDSEYDSLNQTLTGFKRQFEVGVLGSLGGFGEVVPDVLQGGANLGMTILGLKGLGVDFGGTFGRVGSVVGKVGGFLRAAAPVALGFGAALGTTALVAGGAIAVIGLLGYAGVKLYQNWDEAKDWMLDIFGDIGSGAKGMANGVIGGINGVIGAMNGLRFDVPDWVPGYGGQSFGLNIPQVPMLAAGGTAISPGMALVGERGPELLHLPRGATVQPLSNGGGGGAYFNINIDARGAASGVGAEIEKVIERKVKPLIERAWNDQWQRLYNARPAAIER